MRFDNLYDVLFTNTGKSKVNTTKTLVFNGDRLDFLEASGKNVSVQSTVGEKKAIEVDKLKITK